MYLYTAGKIASSAFSTMDAVYNSNVVRRFSSRSHFIIPLGHLHAGDLEICREVRAGLLVPGARVMLRDPDS